MSSIIHSCSFVKIKHTRTDNIVNLNNSLFSGADSFISYINYHGSRRTLWANHFKNLLILFFIQLLKKCRNNLITINIGEVITSRTNNKKSTIMSIIVSTFHKLLTRFFSLFHNYFFSLSVVFYKVIYENKVSIIYV